MKYVENTVEPDKPQMTIWRMRSARLISGGFHPFYTPRRPLGRVGV
jgi:hypothetical protein